MDRDGPEQSMTEVLAQDLHEVVEAIWTLTLGFDASRANGSCPPPAQSPWCGCVRVGGAWNGLVKVSMSEALTRRAAAAMFGAPAEGLSHADLTDALAEITNMTGGSVKALLPGPSRLSLPHVVTDAYFSIIAPGGVLLREVAFQSHASQVRVQVIELPPPLGRSEICWFALEGPSTIPQ
jgi:chemotaxis protein CheX